MNMPKTKKSLRVAYFTMEIALEKDIPTYAGGLGVLAADLMRSAADLEIAACCVTICWQHGYMKQEIKLDGSQQYQDIAWHPRKHMKRLPKTVTVKIEGRDVIVGGWMYPLKDVPVFFLDTNLDGRASCGFRMVFQAAHRRYS